MVRSYGSSKSSSSGLHAAPEDDDYESFPESYPFIGLYDRPLPCCGCGIGWFSFILGFIMPLAWCYGAFLYWTDYYHYDPRERSGLAACAVVALLLTITLVIIAFVMIVKQ